MSHYPDPKLQHWETRWHERKLRWHKDEVNPNLIKFIHLLTQEETESGSVNENVSEGLRRKKRVLVPLCGKTKDLEFLVQAGFEVFGVEQVKTAIEELNEENPSFQLEFDDTNSVYVSRNYECLRIYYGDFFQFPAEKWGPFDCIWDRASLTAIDISARPHYINVIQRCLKNELTQHCSPFRYLLQVVEYDKTNWDGRGPKCVDEQDMKNLFESWANITLHQVVGLPDGHIIRLIPNIGGANYEKVYLLTPKNQIY